MDLIKAGLLVLSTLVVVYGIGLLLTKKIQIDTTFAPVCCRGVLGMLASFELLALPCIFLKTSFTLFVTLECIVLLVLAIGGYCKGRHILIEAVKRMPETVLKKENLLYLPVILLIALQMFFYVWGMHIDDDDAFFVATAATSVHTDTMLEYSAYTGSLLEQLPSRYVFSPFYLLYGFYSKIFALPSAVIAHTVLPPLMLLMAYGVYNWWGTYLFKEDKRKKVVFLLLVSLVHLFGYSSIYTAQTFLLTRVWQGKAFLAGALLPLLLLLMHKMMQKKGESYIVLLAGALSCSLASSMGIFLGGLMIGMMAVIHLVTTRKFASTAAILLCSIPCIILACGYLMTSLGVWAL